MVVGQATDGVGERAASAISSTSSFGENRRRGLDRPHEPVAHHLGPALAVPVADRRAARPPSSHAEAGLLQHFPRAAVLVALAGVGLPLGRLQSS